MFRQLGLSMGVVSLCLSHVGVAADEPSMPDWIWGRQDRNAGGQVCLFTRFDLNDRVLSTRLRGVADYCRAALYVNGQRVGGREPYGPVFVSDVVDRLKAGQNTIGVCCRSVDGPAAVFLCLDLEFANRRQQTIVTDKRWQATRLEGDNLDWPQIEGVKPKPVAVFGRVARFPWGETSDTVTIRPLDDYTQWKQAQGTKTGTDPASFRLLPGFEIELLRSAQQGEDSWVAIVFDPQGRLVVAKEKLGLLRFTLTKTADEEIQVETIDEKLRECRGLLFAHGSLYAMANNDKGLYRLRDTNGDDRFDQVRLLKTFDGEVGHGRNQLVLGPDGLIYAIFGDSVYEPQDAKKRPSALSYPPRAEKPRSGFLARADADGREWEVLVRGFAQPVRDRL